MLQYNTKKWYFCTTTAGAAVCRPRFTFIVLARLFGVGASRGERDRAAFAGEILTTVASLGGEGDAL